MGPVARTLRRAAAALLALVAAILASTAALAATPTPTPAATASPAATPTPSPSPAASPSPAPSASPSASGAANCGVTNFQSCLNSSTNDVTQTIWDSMTKLVADAARSVILGLGCELTVTGSPDVPGTSQAAGPLCAGTQGGQSKGLLSPDLTGAYFSQYYQRAAVVAGLIALGVGMAAAAFFAVTRNGIRLAYAAIGYPSLVAIGIVVAPGLLATILRLTDDLGFYVAGPATLSNAFQNLAGIFQMPAPAGTNVGGTPPPVFVIMVTSLASMLFGLVGIIELLARSVAVYLVVLFWPLALASSAWGGGFGLARRFLRVIVAVILGKPVMVIVLSLGVGLISTVPLDLISMVEGVMVLLVALLAPLVPFVLFGGAEAAIAGQISVRGRLEQAFGAGGGGDSVPVQAGSATTAAGANGALPASPVAIAPAAGGGRGRALLRKSTDGSVVEGSN